MPGELWLADTNLLLRWLHPQDPEHGAARGAVQKLENVGAIPCFTPQNIGEFWNVLTRPSNRNGYGLSPVEADARASVIESRFRLFPDVPAIYEEWRRLLVAQSVSGAQVHDARLVASMNVHGVRNLLTFNVRDFVRYPTIKAQHPSQL